MAGEHSMGGAMAAFRLDGKAALVSGAGRGLGASCAEILAEAGAKVMVTDVMEDWGKGVVERITRSGGTALFRRLNVTEEKEWITIVQETVQAFGGLDVVVNNAGTTAGNLFEDITIEEWQKVMKVNSDGVFLGTKQAIRAMKPGGIAGKGGSIINMSSLGGFVALYGNANYCASKGAVRMMSKVAAVECGKLKYGIRVNTVHPGVILTELTKQGLADTAEKGLFASAADAEAMYASLHPLGRLGSPLDVAQAVLYLASEASSFVTGTEIVVDGGYLAQ